MHTLITWRWLGVECRCIMLHFGDVLSFLLLNQRQIQLISLFLTCSHWASNRRNGLQIQDFDFQVSCAVFWFCSRGISDCCSTWECRGRSGIRDEHFDWRNLSVHWSRKKSENGRLGCVIHGWKRMTRNQFTLMLICRLVQKGKKTATKSTEVKVMLWTWYNDSHNERWIENCKTNTTVCYDLYITKTEPNRLIKSLPRKRNTKVWII